MIAGFGLIDNKSVLIIGQEKGEDLNTRIERNFGMMRPEGYRKCIRLMKLADRFQIPVVSFIDTPGAYPGNRSRTKRPSFCNCKFNRMLHVINSSKYFNNYW